jgi:hypothetical protein
MTPEHDARDQTRFVPYLWMSVKPKSGGSRPLLIGITKPASEILNPGFVVTENLVGERDDFIRMIKSYSGPLQRFLTTDRERRCEFSSRAKLGSSCQPIVVCFFKTLRSETRAALCYALPVSGSPVGSPPAPALMREAGRPLHRQC